LTIVKVYGSLSYMPQNKYYFQKFENLQRERSLIKSFFRKSSDLTSAILLHLEETNKIFVENLPNAPILASVKWLLSDNQATKKPNNTRTDTIKSRIKNLEKQGLIFKDKNKNSHILTQKGKKVVSTLKEKYDILKKPWDKKFRIVVFDIPEKQRFWRTAVRDELNLMQYVLLQKSVYVGKYPLAKSFLEQLNEVGISQFVFIFTAEHVDKEEEIKKMLT